MFRVITWNVNSVRVRMDRTLALLKRHQPDLLCLQELKCEEKAYPKIEFEALGYRTVLSAQKGYNGVAVLHKEPLEHDEAWFATLPTGLDTQARVITAVKKQTAFVCAYFPNGGTPNSEKFEYKLAWMQSLHGYLKALQQQYPSVVLNGDFNVAPDDMDCAYPELWEGSVLCHHAVREQLLNIQQLGFFDVFRKLHPNKKELTWWDYQMLGFQKNNGLRIDHFFVTEPAFKRIHSLEIDREERKGKGASDHAPVICDFKFE